MDRRVIVVLMTVMIVLLVGCAAGPNPMTGVADDDGEVAGFWMGIWHGLIAPVTFVVSLFNRSVSVYEIHNNGGWYNVGFLFGMMTIFGGSGGGAARSRRHHA